MVDVVASQVPVQPERFRFPSVSAALAKSPLLSRVALPLIAGLVPREDGD
jgi:hypothetical protein